MNYKQTNLENKLQLFKKYYIDISGGIDGYFEKTILEATTYEVYDTSPLGYFTIHEDRGLTSLIVLDDGIYESLFDYVINLELVTKILFTENDQKFLKSIHRNNITYHKQAINFEANDMIQSSLTMKKTSKQDISRIYNKFNEFIDYNNMNLTGIQSFFYEKDNDIICFGGLEPMLLNENRYAISMIVDEKYRKQGYGTNTVRYLIQYLQANNKEVNARCYIKNQASKHTLLSSGLKISNHLYRVDKV